MKSRWVGSVVSFLLQPPPPPLLPVAATDRQRMMRSLHDLQLGVPAFVLGATATIGLLFSDKFPGSKALNFAIVGWMGAAALLFNGTIFAKINIQALGISLYLLSLYALVASFLPIAFSCFCCLSGAFCLVPFIYFLIKAQPAPAAA